MPQRRPLAVQRMNTQKQHDYGVFCQNIKDQLNTPIPTFPTPPVLPAALQTLIDNYTTALTNAAFLGVKETAAVHSTKFLLHNAMVTNALYINQIIQGLINTGTSYADCRLLIATTGYYVSDDPSPIGPLPKPVIQRVRSTVPGQLSIIVKRIPGAKSYIIKYGPAALPFNQLTTTVDPISRIIIDGLPSASIQQAYVAGIGADQSVLNFSDQIIQVIV